MYILYVVLTINVGGDCQTTTFPIDSETIKEKSDYLYKYLEDSRENNNGLNILRNKNVDLLRNDMPLSRIQMLPLYNFNTVKSIDTLDDFGNNGNMELCKVIYIYI